MSKKRREGFSTSLFPFLDVMICTMGTLMLLLAIVTRQAKVQSKEIAASIVQSEVQPAIEDANWQADQFQAIRDKQTEELEKRRDQLAHLEDHIERLNQQLRQLTDQVAAAQDPSDVSALEADVERLKQNALALQESLSKRNAEVAQMQNRPPKVALLPFRGPNGTMRRPIYIECANDYITIQPEGIKLSVNALRGPLGPGNPLDAGLRAIRVHYQSIDTEPPYPLLVVRPNGILAYAVARTAMAAWDDQFGYELVPAEVELAYQPPDPRLKEKLQLAISEAVQRRNAMMAGMPGRFRDEEADAVERIIASANQGSGSGKGNGSGTGNQLQPIEDGVFQPASSNGSQGLGLAQSRPGASGTDSGDGPDLVGGNGYGSQRSAQAGASSSSGMAGSMGQSGTSNLTPGGSTSGQGQSSGNPSNDSFVAGSSTQDGATKASWGTDASAAKNMANAAGGPGGENSMMSVGTSNDQFDPGNQRTNTNATNTKKSSSQNGNGQASQPISRSKGKNWALPENARTNGPAVVRKINVRCMNDRYEIVNQTGAPTRFAIDSSKPDAAVVALAAHIRQRVESWGGALAGGRWEPTLVIDVTPDGKASYERLCQLLEGSGLVVQLRTAL